MKRGKRRAMGFSRGRGLEMDAQDIRQRRSFWFIALLPTVTILSFAALPGIARADFRVCNSTQSLVGVAIGYRAKAGWITEGWWHVEPLGCKTIIEGPLSSRYYYLYAEDAKHGSRWDGPINMCVAEKEFKIVGIKNCFARGFQRVGFQEYDTGEQSSWMVQLTDEPAPKDTSPPASGSDNK